MENKELIDIGRIKIEFSLQYTTIKRLKIDDVGNEHGHLELCLVGKETYTEESLLKLENAPIKVLLDTGEIIFSGCCKGIGLNQKSQYAELIIQAQSHSIQTDIKKNSRTFQKPSKTISEVANAVMGTYGISVAVKEDIVISEMLYQFQETDWAFLKRIANEYGYVLFTDCKSDKLCLSIGATGFKPKELEDTTIKLEATRKINDFAKLKYNILDDAVASEYEEQKVESFDLTIGAGYLVKTTGRVQVAMASHIMAYRGIVINTLTLAYEQGARSGFKQARDEVMTSGILTGIILEVKQSYVKVHFDVDDSQALQDAMWIPYENEHNNYMYSMPDVGDKAFVYYDKQGTVVCIGSRRNNGESHVDFDKTEYKMLNTCNKMIKFTPESVEFVANRTMYDGVGTSSNPNQSEILFKNKEGIEINSTQDIEITAGRNVHIMATDEALETAYLVQLTKEWQQYDKLEKKFEGYHQKGKNKYETEKGRSDLEQGILVFADSAKDVWDDFKEDISGMAESLDPRVGWQKIKQSFQDNEEVTVQVPEGAGDAAPMEREELILPTTALINMTGYNSVIFNVNNQSEIRIDNEEINIYTLDYRELGYNHFGEYEIISKENRDWMDSILDVGQMVLDVVGTVGMFFPPVGLIANGVNALISVMRGNYVDAFFSLLGCFGCSAVGTLGKAANKLTTVQKLAKGAMILKTFFVQGSSLFNNIANGIYMHEQIQAKKETPEGFHPLSNREDFDMFVQAYVAPTCSITNVAVTTVGSRIKKNQTLKNAEKSNEATKANGFEPKRSEHAIDPVNLVTGSFTLEQPDLILNDIGENFEIRRIYESIYTNVQSSLGNKWFLNIESYLMITENKIVVMKADRHLESFERVDGLWRNERNGDSSYYLKEAEGSYKFGSCTDKKIYYYNQQGRLEKIVDHNNNQTKFIYMGQQLKRIELASSQYVEFEYDHHKISKIVDTIGRSIYYTYEGEWLKTVTYPNQGTITYEYTKEGYIEKIIDQNGHAYVKNTYDRKGRVIKQGLANGEEYILLYDDANRTNTIITTSNNRRNTYVYNKDQLIIKRIYTDETYEEVQYDLWENRIYEKDRNGGEIFRKYDEHCLLLEERLPDGLIINYEYNQYHDLVRCYDNAGREITYAYDKHRNLLRQESRIDDIRSQCIQNKIDAHGRIIEVIDANKHSTYYSYDKPFNLATEIITAENDTFEYQYDEAGRNMSIVTAYGKTEFAYNHMNYQTMIIDNEKNITKYYYDKLGNLEKEILPNNTGSHREESISYVYDELDHLIRTIDPLGNVFALKCNTEGKVIKEINPNTYTRLEDDGQGIINVYDEDENKIKILYPDGEIERIKYDAKGNIIKKISPGAYHEKIDDGSGYTYEYDKADRLIQITGPNQVVLKRYVYDLVGRIIKEIETKGYLQGSNDNERIGTLYQYNYAGWLLEKRVPVRREEEVYYELTQYQYDLVGNRIQEKRYIEEQTETSSFGSVHTIDFEYDNINRLVKVSDCTGAVIEYHYDALNHKIYEKRKINEEDYQVTKYKYNSIGRLIEMAQSADKAGSGKRFAYTRYTYDPTGNLIKIQTPKGYLIERTYDAANRLIKETHEDKEAGIHNQITMTYDAAGNVTQITDVNGQSTKFEYDLLNRQIRQISPGGATSRTYYDANGKVSKVIKPVEYAAHGESGKGYCYTYDLQGHLTTVMDPTGKVIETNTYNESGELIQRLDAMQNGVSITYDLAGRQQKIETTGGATQSYEYDARGNIIGITDGNHEKTSYRLDKWGRIIEIRKADESVEQYTYDFAGNIVTTIDGNKHTITYNYNSLNKLKEIIDQEGSKETFIYDAEGNLKEHTDRNGTKVQYAFNIYGSLLSRSTPQSNLSESYTYYPDGKLQSALAGGMRYHYTYDPDGNLTEKSASGRTLIAYTYDLNGNKITQRDVTGKTTTYSYNILDQLTKITDHDKCLVSYTYHLDGSLASMDQLNGLHTQYTYDSDRNLKDLEVHLDGKTLVKNTYTYDNNGNRLQKSQLNSTTTYQYDQVNRLSKVIYPTYTEELFYDPAGNRIKRQAKDIEELYTYDVRNRLTTLTKNHSSEPEITHFEYDAQGNLLKDDQAAYTYDAFNRTQKIETISGNIQINHYDAEGLRHEIEENGRIVQFIFNQHKEVIVEKTESDTLRLIRGYDITASESQQARTYYHYVSDELGSTTHIFKDKECCNHYEYDAFGNLTACEEKIANRYKYTGEQQDPLTQQYYLRARYYNPVIARFTQEDIYRNDGLNLYAYCDSNPVIYVDPSGYVCIVKEALYREARNQIDSETGDIYTAEKAYKLADEQWRNIERSQREYIAKQLQDYRKNTGRKLEYSKANQVIRTSLDAHEKTTSKSGSGSNKIDYKKVFFEQNPELEGKVVVHHSIEQQVLKRYPGLFTVEEINAYDMLRGIPKDINSKVHLSDIRIEWNNFYKKVDVGEIALTKESFLNEALEIDKLFGSQFQPPR